jgi:peptidoglycan/LPS O-acetylase OafA/YrhL
MTATALAQETPPTPLAAAGAAGSSGQTPHLAWIDGIKGLALLWIILVHWTERVFGNPLFANPGLDWPPLPERIAQLQPLPGYGVWDWPLSLLRLAGWMGDGGVQLFLIASGFGVTLALLRRRESPNWGDFYRRRLGRIYPMWWLAHLGILALGLVVQRGISPASDVFWLSFLGFRATPETLYAFSHSWWFIGLILQLYGVFPLLYAALSRLGWVRFAVIVIGGAVLVRGAGLWLFAGPLADWGYLDAWSRGAIFVSRLPEFAAGMALAAAWQAAPDRVDRWLRSGAAVVLAAIVMTAGFALSFFLLGNAVAFLLFGSGAFVLLSAVLVRPLLAIPGGAAPLLWLSRHSLSLFLTHQLALEALVPADTAVGLSLWLRTAAALALAVIAALALEAAVRPIGAGLTAARARWGGRGTWLRVGVTAACLYALLLAGEIISRRVAPQEVAGWGERPALAPHPIFGWTLRPSTTTRLRWVSYDYTVTANALGFPGPAYPDEKPAGSVRILTTGDAFTSAEGVDTAQAWPRLLEGDLARRNPGRPVEVMNLAMTGYGPEQYAAVLQAFVPTWRPDVVIVTLFVNDLEDVLISPRQFQRSIGFGRPDGTGLFATLALGNLYELTGHAVRRLLFEQVLRRPDPQDRFFAMLPAFAASTGDAAWEADGEAKAAVERALLDIMLVAEANGSRLIALLVPAGVQVCTPEQLRYFPKHVDLADANRFDMERPQRLLGEVTSMLGIETHDLRDVLRAAPSGCPYQPRNLHWLPTGHQAVAAFVANLLTDREKPPTAAP